MAYNAYITKIKNIRKHINADRLMVGECFGNSVIIGLDTKENSMGVYFPTDGKLGIEYAEKNNLLRKKDENGNNIGGYLDQNKRNIKTLKLRGETSDGLFMPLESLSEFCDIEKLKEGDKIDILNGILICEKYIPRTNRRSVHSKYGNNNKTKNELKLRFPLFKEHIDTNQFAYNKHVFKKGDECIITLKMHGCFTSQTRVKKWNEEKAVKLREIKIGDILVGYKDKKLVPTKVLNIFNNGKGCNWQKLSISRCGYAGEEKSMINCTSNHKFYVKNKDLFIEAKYLKKDDIIHTVKKSLILDSKQKEILVGKLLGDGYYFTRKLTSCFEFSHKEEHEDYINYCIDSLNNLAYKVNKKYISGYGTKMVRAKTHDSTDMKHFFDNILSKNKQNKLTENIINYFSEISLAFLYMDDGSLSHTEYQKDRANFAICDYNDFDANIIIKCFNKLGLNPVLYKDSKGYNRLRLNTKDAYKMFNMIKKYIPLIMKYKLPSDIKNYELKKINTFSKTGFVFIENKIISNEYYFSKKGKMKYDIETETHNYVVHDCLVHNSSGRTTNTLEFKKQNFIQKLLKIKPQKTWKTISGTRRVILNSDTKQKGYYDDNDFRYKFHNMLSDKLEKGETIYYEIIGWVNHDTSIMPSCKNSKTKDKEFIKKYGEKTTFSYGCNIGENDIYVYRMTSTNEDGYEIEYPWNLVKIRCEQMGLKYCLELDKFTFETIEELEEKVNEHCDGVDPIGKTHIREGCVIRIENRPKFTAYKHKNTTFKILEGIIKEEDVLDIEEAQEVND
jgi:hypothetical protein